MAVSWGGSSPRLWGTLRELRVSPFLRRFIPTLVGNSHLWYFLSFDTFGSSPRLWGTPTFLNSYSYWCRFIPTLVGNSPFVGGFGIYLPVHPHACGELQSRYRFRMASNGSSPRLWGTLICIPDRCLHIRFIPTLVGNSISRAGGAGEAAVHPHACGELVKESYQRGATYGSSPRLWGTQITQNRSGCRLRFIPTLVGNSVAAACSAAWAAVHPHACGELMLIMLSVSFDLGSSPRLWGTPISCHGFVYYRRFIPTLVGNSTIGMI